MNNPNIDLNFPKDADITEILGMDEKLKDMESHLNANVTDSQINLNKKIAELNDFVKNQYVSRLYNIKQNTIADTYKNGINFCRSRCFNENSTNFESKEKQCFRNCFNKYSNTIDIYNQNKNNLFEYYGLEIFSLKNEDSQNIGRVIEFLKGDQ